MAMDLTGISNVNEFYTDHYLASILENDLKDLFKQWAAAEQAHGVTPPDRQIAALSQTYFKTQAALERVRSPQGIMEAQRPVLAGLLDALGYAYAPTEQSLERDGVTVPLLAGVAKDSGAPDLWILETLCPVAELTDPLDLGLHACQYKDGELAAIPEHEDVDELVTKHIFSRAEPPRWVILLNFGTVVLIDRSKWNEKRLLRFDLKEILSRREASTLKAFAALLHRESICPGDGIPLLDTLGENSHKHAYSVSEDLKYAVREAIELLGNEAVWYLRDVRRRGVFGSSESAEAVEPAALTHECLRYLYRLLFLFYIEARPELGYAPLKSEEYRLGYSLESLRALEMVPLNTPESQDGFYLHESLQMLFDLVFKGFEPGKKELTLGLEGSAHHTFDMAPLKSHLFDPGRTTTLNRCKFRNKVLQRIIHLLSLSSGRGQRGRKQQRRGRISYAQLGINQLGAVYEGLLSYSGFFVTNEGGLYEVKKAGEAYDELENAYFVPAAELNNYSEDEKFIPQPDPDHPGRTVNRLKHYPRGVFIYRLAGRNRQKSASYYTPEVLTQCVVKYALKELLRDKTADDILQLTICEPAMGSGAFLNEAINQLADAYLKARQLEIGERLGHDAYGQELQKVKAYMAANNVYGVDLNPVAVELAEVSLWLNTIHPGCPVPWFNMQLVAGNSLIGARRQAFDSHLLRPKKGEKSWRDDVPVRYPLKPAEGEPTERPADSVYHFLLPDTGMANYNDKVVKQMAGVQLDTIREWRRAFCKPFETHHIAILERLSAVIDRLWLEHIRDCRKLRDETRDAWDFFGYSVEGATRALTTQEKDRLFNDRILSRIDANSSAYRRLKLVMDYWCALWFWPIDQAEMLPTREAFLLEIQSIIEGGVIESTLIENNQYMLKLGDIPVQQELDIYQESGYVNLEKLCRDYPRLALVQELAERYRFHHWELEFADLFDVRGGFDLVLGNPPWIKVEWSEGGVLGDINPRFVFDKLTADALSQLREDTLNTYSRLRAEYLAEFEEAETTQNFLNSYQNYPMLRGIQTNLFKCFIPQTWNIGSNISVIGFLHDDGIFNDPKGNIFRVDLYQRLLYYFQFENELKLFSEVGNAKHFEITISKAQKKNEVNFDSISNIFSPKTIDSCYNHPGIGSVPGIKDDYDKWEITGHADRIAHIDEKALALFAEVYDKPGISALEARLPVIHASEVLSVLEKFSNQPRRLGDWKDSYFPTVMWDETGAKKAGTIRRDTQFPKEIGQWILSGPHFYVGKPFHQTPRRVCETHRAYDNLDLEILPDAYLPRTNYIPACNPVIYNDRTPKVHWNNRPVTEFYRLVSRTMLNQAGERTLTSVIMPRQIGHLDLGFSLAFIDHTDLLIWSALFASIPYDFYVKTTGKGHFRNDVASALPYPKMFVQKQLQIRSLLLTCLTSHYDDLWTKCWNPEFREEIWTKEDPRLDSTKFTSLTSDWNYQSALRTDFERRQVLVEIDVLAAMALVLTCDELCAIYRIQFPVLRQNEADTWYDQNGRIIFTCSKGLPGVGLDRPQWEQESSLDKLTASGLRIDGINPSDFSTIKSMPHGIVTRTVTDDTIADYRFAYGTFRKDGVEYHCPRRDHPELIEGPVERDITYVAPFTKCDREEDYRIAWKHFEERLRQEERMSHELSNESHARAEIPG